VVDAHGIPLAVLMSAANVHDERARFEDDARHRRRHRRRHRAHPRQDARADIHPAFVPLGCVLISLRFLG
jgi:hypothetical protein